MKYPPTVPAGATVAWEKSSATIIVVVIGPISLILGVELIVPVGLREFMQKIYPPPNPAGVRHRSNGGHMIDSKYRSDCGHVCDYYYQHH